MRFKVKILPAALIDAEEYVVFVREQKHEPHAAVNWYDGLSEAILSLTSMPNRCPVIPEQDSFRFSLRHLHYHSHRIIFHADEVQGIVYVLRVYHGAREAIDPTDTQLP